jgi:hypothetical protein
MRIYKIANQWIDLDHVLSVSECWHEDYNGQRLEFRVQFMFVNEPIKIVIPIPWQNLSPEEDEEEEYYPWPTEHPTWTRKKRTQAAEDRLTAKYEAEYLRMKWTVYSDFVKAWGGIELKEEEI